MYKKESMSSSVKSDSESFSPVDISLVPIKNEFNNYDNPFTPQVPKTEIENSEISLENDILNGYTKDEFTNFSISHFNQPNKYRLKRVSHLNGNNIKSLSEGECDFEKDYKFNDCLPFYETGDISNFSYSNIPTKDADLECIVFEKKKLKIEKVLDIEEDISINDLVKEFKPDESCIEKTEYIDIEKNIDYVEKDENCVDIVTSSKMTPKCFNSTNGTNIESVSYKDNDKNVELKNNECSLTNEFFETIENINIKIIEKQNNLKESVEKLMEVVQKSDFENRVNDLVKKSEENSEIIEQFKKKSEDCIRQCRKFETTSENLIGECINTLAQATVCYAEWVCLHSSDLKQIDKDLEDIDLFIKNTAQ